MGPWADNVFQSFNPYEDNSKKYKAVKEKSNNFYSTLKRYT